MTVIRRRDKTLFVLNTYREVLTRQEQTRRLRDLINQTNPAFSFARCDIREDQTVTLTLAKEPGYLLGESIRAHFFTYPHLIFCEYRADADILALIVIQNGRVCVDRCMQPSELAEELMPLALSATPFHCVLAGPEFTSTTPPHWAHPLILLSQQQEVLSHSLIDRLPILATTELMPLAKVAQPLSRELQRRLVLGVVVALLLLLSIAGFTYREHWRTKDHSSHALAWSAYMKVAAQTPTTQQQLTLLLQAWQRWSFVPGWHLSKLSVQPSQLTAQMQQQGGSLITLLQHIEPLQATIHWQPTGLTFSNTLSVAPTTHLPALHSLAHTQLRLSHLVNFSTVHPQLQLISTQRFSDYQIAHLTLILRDTSLNELSTLARQLNCLPLILTHASLQQQQWQWQATLQLTAWGTA